MKNIVKKQYNNLTDQTTRCRFLLIMSYLLTLFLILLNLYILYTIVQYFTGDGFSFLGGLFIAFSFVITIPVLIFSLKNIGWIVEGKKQKRIFPTIISILGILVGLILHNATELWVYILGFNVLLLLSCIFCEKVKIDNSKVPTLILAITLTISLSGFSTSLSAQTNNNVQEIYLLDKNDFNPYVEFVSTDITDMFNPEKSSNYPSLNLFDGSFSTCWVLGSIKTERKETLFIKLPEEIGFDNIILNIFSGYGKSKSLFIENARSKKIRLSIFAAYYPKGYATEVAVPYIIKKYYESNIELLDTFGVQSFPLDLNNNNLMDFYVKNRNECKSFKGDDNIKVVNTTFILKLEIVDVYKGAKYDDICISEIFFNNRFITLNPDKYTEILDVYIENDNTLLANYKEQKGVVIYKDTSSVFTMVDWIEKGNFAILHYVPNDEVGVGSRIEEHYSLIDLKNRNIIDSELKKCTGDFTSFYFLEIDEDGKIYLNNEQFKIELK